MPTSPPVSPSVPPSPPSPPVSPPPPSPPPPPPGAPPALEVDYPLSRWDEVMDQKAPGGPEMFAQTGQSAGLVVFITPPEREGFLRNVGGYAYADPASPWRLRRVNPLPHPYWSHMRASRIGFQQFQPAGNPANDEGKPKVDPPGSELPVTAFGYYAGCMATVEFTPVPYRVVEDADFNASFYLYESDRNVDYFAEMSSDLSIISADAGTGSTLTFVEGPTGDGQPNGKKFPGEIGVQVLKASRTWLWEDVPAEYVLNQFGKPKKLLAGLGKVNDADFRDDAAGTLLLQAVNLKKFQYPWLWDDGSPAFGFDITFVVSEFDPLPAVPAGTPGPLARGHNLLPWSQRPGANGSIWYLATRADQTTGVASATSPRYLEQYDYRKLFEHVGAP